MFRKHENCLKDYVECENCKCILEKKKAQKLELHVIDYWGGIFEEYYCGKCAKPYDKVVINNMKDEEKKYYSSKERRVDENGKILDK